MKKALFTLLLLCCVVLLVWLAAFFWKHLRGAGPALKSPAVDIVRLIEKPGCRCTGHSAQAPAGVFSINLRERAEGPEGDDSRSC